MKNLRFISLVLGLSAFGFAFTASAQTGTWVLDGDGTWGDTNNWAGYIVASGSGNTANFTFELTGTRTVTNDSPRTIQNITFTDTSSSHDLTISGANTLTLAGGTPIIDVTQSGRTLTLSSTLSGSNGLTKAGAGTLTVSGVNTYTGATTVAAGTLKLQSTAGALPVSGAAIWLRADGITGLSDGTAVATWPDESGNARHATQGTAGNRPLYYTSIQNGLPVVRFDGSNDWLGYDGTFLGNTDYTIFLVEARGDTDVNYILQGTDNSGNRNLHVGYRNNTTFTHAQYANDYDMTVAGYVGAEFAVYALDCNAAESAGKHTWRNGVALGSKADNTRMTSYAGARIGGNGGGYRGDVCELVMYTRALSTAERQQVEAYLAKKWLGALPAQSAVALADASSILDANGTIQNIGSLAGVSGSEVRLNGGSLTIGNERTSTTYSGVIADGDVSGGGIVKIGGGDLTLGGDAANTFTGATTLHSGRIGLAKTGGAYAIPGNFIGIHEWSPDVYATVDNQFAPGAVMYFRGNSGDHVRFELLGTIQTLAGIDNAGGRSGYGVIQHREQVTVPAVGSLSTLILNGSGTNVFSGYLRDTGGTLSLVKSGTGMQTLSGTLIDYAGATAVNNGTLRLLDLDDFNCVRMTIATGAMLDVCNTTTRNFARFTNTSIEGDGAFVKTGTGVLTTGNSGGYARWNMTGGLIDVREGTFRNDYTTVPVAWGNNKASMNVAGGAVVSMVGGNHISVDALTGSGTVENVNNWGTGIFTVGQNNGSGTFGGILRDNGGPLALAKVGTGTQTLSGTNTYTGATAVNAGTLTVNGSLANANMTITNGTVNGNGTIHYRIAGAVSDLITVNSSGSITIAGLTFNVVLSNALAKAEYVIITDASKVTGASFAAVNLPSAHWSVDYDGTAANPGAVVLLFNPDAALSTWDGETSGSWALGQNWLANIPLINGLPLVFPSGAGNKQSTNDLLASALSLTLEGGYTIGGNALRLENSVNNTGINELTLPLSLAPGARTFDVSGELTLSGAVSGAGGIAKTNSGTLVLSSVNSYSGATTVSGGALKLQPPVTTAPSSLSGLTVHLDATQITQASGSDVATWANLVVGGAGDFAASTGTAAPLFHSAGNLLNGLPLVKFRNSVTLRNTSFNYTNQNNTVMFAGRMDGGQSARLVGGATNNWLLGYHGGYQNRSHPATWLNQPNTGIDFTTRIYGQVMTANGRTAEFFGNGIRLAGPVNNSGFRGPDGLTLGGYLTTSEMSLGSLGEVLVFNRALTDVERQQMETYLQAKWQGPLNPLTDVAITGGGSLNLNGVNQTIGSLAGDSTGQVLLNGGWLTVGTVNTNTTYSGVIADGATGGGTLAKTGSGVLTLAGDASNSYTGPTVLQAGRIHLAKTGGAYAIPGDFLVINNAQPYVYATQDNQFAPGSVMYFLNNEGDHVRFELLGTTQTLGGIDNGGMANRGVIQHRENISAGLQVSTISTLMLDVAEGDAYLFAGYLRHQNNTLSLVKSGTGMQTLRGGNITYNGITTVNAGTLVLQDTTGFASYMSMVPGSTLKLIRTVTGFSNRGNLTRLITGSGTINVNATDNSPGATDGGWVRFETAGTRGLDNFTGTVNVNSGNLTRDNVSTWSGNPTLNVYNNAFFGIRNVDTSVDGLNGNGHVGNDYNGDTAGHTLTVGAANGSGAFSGVIHGSVTGGTDGMIDQGIVHFAKAGSGTQTLSGTNTYSGTTTVRAGTLLLDFSAAGAPASNILLSGRSLVLAGGTLEIKGATGQNGTVQTFGNTTVNATSTLKLTQNGATTADLNLGALMSNGAGINFAGGTGTALGARFITTTSAGANDGQTRLLSCTWNGSEWASVKEVGGVKYVVPWEGSYTNIATGTESGGSVVVPNAPTSAVSILEGGTTGGPNQLEQATTTIGTLKMIADTTPATLRMNVHGANDTLVLGSGANGNGTVWVEEGAQALTLGQSAGQGFITAGSSGASTLSLVANNPDPERGITVHSRIQNNAGGGAVSLNVAGDGVGGTVVVTANNSYTGPTGIGGGTLQIAGTGSLGEGTYAVGIINNGLLRYSSSAGQTLSGVISGTGSLLKDTDASVLTLTGNNTYSGSTTVSNGILKLQGAAFYAGARTYSIASGAVLNLDGTFNSSMPANSTTTINGAGTLRFTGGTFFLNNGAGGKNVAISLGAGGVIDVQPGSTLGNGGWASIIWSANLAALNVDGTVDVWDGNTLYVDALTGNGVLTHTTYGNGQNITVGVNNGSGTFSGTITQQNASRITSLTKAGSGTQTLTGTNSYSGATTVSAGTLQIGDGGTTGTLGSGAVINNAALVFNRSDAYNVTNVISGIGTLTQAGTGTLTLTATNTYTGATFVNGGTLRVNGALAAASAVTVTNAALAWMGTIYGSVTLNNGGKLLMDSSDIRTVGSLTLNEGSILDVSGLTLTGYEVPLLNYTSLTGTFTTLNAPAGWKIDYNYNSEKIIALVKERGTMFIFQ